MANATFVQEGVSIPYTPSAAVAAGAIVNLGGGLIGIAKVPIAASAVGALAIEGVFNVIKDGTTGPVFAVGEPVFFDTITSLAIRTNAGGCLYMGHCIAAAGTNDATVRTELARANLPAAMQNKLWEDVSLAGGSKTLDVQDTGKVINITAGHATNVVTLPAVATGNNFVVRNGVTGDRVAVDPAAADGIHGPDLAGTDNKDRINTAATSKAGDFIALAGGLAAGFVITAEYGIWAQEA